MYLQIAIAILAGIIMGTFGMRYYDHSNQKERCVLAVTILNKALKVRDGYYIITRIEEAGAVRGLKYFELWVMEYDLLKKKVSPGKEEIELTLAENVIEKADNVQIVQEGMLGFNNGGILKIFQRP